MIACFSGCNLAKSENRHKHSKPGRYDEPVAEQQGYISVTESWSAVWVFLECRTQFFSLNTSLNN